MFGLLIILQDKIGIQILTFILHTVIRTFIHSSAAGIYVNVFHMRLVICILVLNYLLETLGSATDRESVNEVI